MRCPDVQDDLVGLAAATLRADRSAAVLSHLAACAGCRGEWDATRLAVAVYAGHLPAETVTALAWGQEPDAAARQHLESCAGCAEDLAMARECRAAEAPALHRPRVPLVRAAGLAAVLVAALAAGALVASRRAGAALDSERRSSASVLSGLRAETERLSREAAVLRERIARPPAPAPNLPIAELFEGALRSGRPAPTVALGPGAPLAVLAFDGGAARPPLSAKLTDGGGRVLWAAGGLVPSPLGAYVVGVPAHALPDGPLTLAVRPERDGAPVRRFPFRVRRTEAEPGQRPSPSSWKAAQ